MRWQAGRDDAGQAFRVDDPLAAKTAGLLSKPAHPAEQVTALLGLTAVFPAGLAADPRLRAALTGHLTLLTRKGALAAVEAVLGG
jgi:fructuronate reductase